jgi:hypothetical protein
LVKKSLDPANLSYYGSVPVEVAIFCYQYLRLWGWRLYHLPESQWIFPDSWSHASDCLSFAYFANYPRERAAQQFLQRADFPQLLQFGLQAGHFGLQSDVLISQSA